MDAAVPEHTSEPDFRRLFEAAPGLFLVLTPNLHIVAASRAYLDATMTQGDLIKGRYLFDVFPDNPADPAADGVLNLKASLSQVLATQVPHRMTVQKYDIRRPDGTFEERYWSPENTPVLWNGRVEYIIHRVEDVTAFEALRKLGAEQQRLPKPMQDLADRMEAEVLRRAWEAQEASRKLALASEELARLHKHEHEQQSAKYQAELEKRERMFQAALEASQEAFDLMKAVRDENGKIIDFEILQVNSSTEKLTGYSRDKLVGGRVSKLFPVSQTGGFVSKYIDVVETRQPWLGEFHISADNVNATWLSQRVVAVGDGVALFTRDVTESKRLECELLQAQKMESIGRLAGGVAHDFNNLLTVILGYAELASAKAGKSASPAIESALKNILVAANRAAELTRHLLTFARRQAPVFRIIDLNGLLDETEKMLSRVIGEDVKLEISRASNLWSCKADSGQISQVLMNLAANARDAMPKGGTLAIETANVVLDTAFCSSHTGCAPGEYVMLTVTDTGEGMSAEIKNRAFEPFFTTKDAGKGTGLGLSTCLGIVQLHGGYIWIESNKGVGSTFKICFPKESGAQTEGRPEAEEPTPKGQESILLVEDDALLRDYTAFTLRSLGYQVVHASGADNALEKSREIPDRIDLLVSDVVMPGMSGRQLAEVLVKERPGLKVLLCSGYSSNVLGQHGVLAHDLNFLSKPFTPSALGRKVREVLDQKPR